MYEVGQTLSRPVSECRVPGETNAPRPNRGNGSDGLYGNGLIGLAFSSCEAVERRRSVVRGDCSILIDTYQATIATTPILNFFFFSSLTLLLRYMPGCLVFSKSPRNSLKNC